MNILFTHFRYEPGPFLNLPMKGDRVREHSWLILDKEMLFKAPTQYWKDNRLSNNIEMVIGEQIEDYNKSKIFFLTNYHFSGASAFSSASDDLFYLTNDWSVDDEYAATVEDRLASFNVTLAPAAMEAYNGTAQGEGGNYAAYAAMLSDIRTVCPLQVNHFFFFM